MTIRLVSRFPVDDRQLSALHVDFEPDLRHFYLDRCGFRTTQAGLLHLG